MHHPPNSAPNNQTMAFGVRRTPAPDPGAPTPVFQGGNANQQLSENVSAPPDSPAYGAPSGEPTSHLNPAQASPGIKRDNAFSTRPNGVFETQINSDSPWLGKRIEKYAIEKYLGGGGMGEVFLGRHLWLDVPVAVKVLRPMFGSDPIAVERFHREAKIVAKLNHPNIVKAIDGGPVDDSLFLVTEFLDGMDLAELVQSRGPLAPSEACAIVIKMCRGLHHAHQHHLVHRDIKPQNAMLMKDGSVKLLDLGLARITMADTATQMTTTGQFMGTVDYVSPEQAIDTKDLDHRADIYSLGCTLYYLLTGRPPYSGEGYESLVSKLLAHTDELAPAISSLRARIPKDLIRIVDRMMAKQPEDRLQTCEAISAELSRFAKPIDVNSIFDSGHFVVNEKLLDHPGTNGLAKGIGNAFVCAFTSLFMMIFRMAGIIERVEANPNSRSSTRPRFRHQLSWGGILAWLILGGLAVYLFSGLDYVEAPPNSGWPPAQTIVKNPSGF